MYDYERTKTADHPGDLSISEFQLGFARAFGTHLMDDLNRETGNKWWFHSAKPLADGFFELTFQMLAGEGRLPMLAKLKIEPHGAYTDFELPYGGHANFGGHPGNKPSVLAAQIASKLKGSFTGE